MQWECNAWTYNNTQSNNFTKKSQKPPKNFQKPQNLGLKCMNACKWRVEEHIPSDWGLIYAENHEGRRFWVKEKCLGEEKRNFVQKEKWKMRFDSHPAYIRKMQLDGSKYLSSTKSWQKWICRGVVEDLSAAKTPQWIENLLRIY